MLLEGDGDGLGAGGCAELFEDDREMLEDAADRDVELLGDVVRGETAGGGGENLKLTVGEVRLLA